MGRLDSVDWNGMVHAISWILLIGFLPPYTPVQTTSKQRPPVNKDHPNLMTIVKYHKQCANPPPRKGHTFIKTTNYLSFQLKC